MKSAVVSVEQLIETSKWRASLFVGDIRETQSDRFEMVTLGDVVTESKIAKDPNEIPYERFYYVGLENVKPITGEPVGVELLTSIEVRSRSKLFKKGDILYGRLRPYLRKALLVEPPYEDGLCSTEFIVLRAKPAKILPVFLRALLVSSPVTASIERLQAGAALPRVSSRDLLGIEIPLPPMAFQESCVDRINQLVERRRQLAKELSIVFEEEERAISDVFD